MSNTQILASVFLASMYPSVTVLVFIRLNRKDAQELRGRMSNVRERLAKLQISIRV
jgi:hypothetical protein